MYFDLGTIDGLVSNLFVFGPAVVAVLTVRSLIRRGCFGPHQGK
jgi:hypothetical protein